MLLSLGGVLNPIKDCYANLIQVVQEQYGWRAMLGVAKGIAQARPHRGRPLAGPGTKWQMHYVGMDAGFVTQGGQDVKQDCGLAHAVRARHEHVRSGGSAQRPGAVGEGPGNHQKITTAVSNSFRGVAVVVFSQHTATAAPPPRRRAGGCLACR